MYKARTDILSRLRSNKSLPTHIEPHIKANKYPPDNCPGPIKKSFIIQELIEKFIKKANLAGMSVSLLADRQDLPQAVSTYLHEQQLPAEINISDRTLEQMQWKDPVIPRFCACGENDRVSLIHAFAGIAETGTIVSLSSITLSTASLFLPGTCLFFLDADTIEVNLEGVMARIKACGPRLPRTINLITGPSRTGDIEQTIQIGAHGPHQVHIFLVSNL